MKQTPAQSYKQAAECNFEIKKVNYKNVWQTVNHIYKSEGLSAFGRGVGPRMALNVPSTALSWGTYEMVKGFLTKE